VQGFKNRALSEAEVQEFKNRALSEAEVQGFKNRALSEAEVQGFKVKIQPLPVNIKPPRLAWCKQGFGVMSFS